ncbi:GatB/YqeY domain-containing protein [Wukongibacter baidiensis]|uniref:GatB/YqeY domain-containing protein n=1 Tax=Wukongibacter baidiensis TaxID=1723361 RepID=UPI003D7F6D6F
MSLKDKLMQDLKAAMKEKDKVKKSVITMIRASIKQYEVDNRTDIDEAGIMELISKQLKQRRDAISEFEKGNRQDLVDETQKEIEVLLGYLPKQLTEDEIREIVKATIEEVGAQSPKDMGKVMGALMPKVKGKADGKLVSKAVKELL